MLKIGDTVPDFSLCDETGQQVALAELLSTGPLVLYFYPADFTPICTSEACTIRDMHDEIVNVDISIVGVSPQDCESHARFKSRYDLPFPLLFDQDKQVICRELRLDSVHFNRVLYRAKKRFKKNLEDSLNSNEFVAEQDV